MRQPSWVERLPAGWRPLQVRHVASVSNSNVDKKSYEDGHPVRLCNYTDVYHNEFITDDMELMAATATRQEIHRFRLRPGDVIITKDSESWDDIAVPACVSEALTNVVCGYHLSIFRPFVGVMSGRFLFRAIQAQGVREQFWIAANGVTRFGLGQQGMKCALVPVPPLPTQLAIANFLDRKTAAIDALIEKKRKLLDLLAEKRAALINQAVTKGLDPDVPMKDSGIPWIGEIPAHWEVKRLKFICTLETGHTPSRAEARFWVEEECVIPWVSLNDTKTLKQVDYISETSVRISPLGMAHSAAHLLPAGSVVFTRDATIGLTAILAVPMAVSQHIIGWVCGPGVYNEFLLRVLDAMAQELDRVTFGATLKTIGMGDVKELTTPLPPLSEQHRVVAHLRRSLDQLRRTNERLLRQIERLKEYRQSLITAAVTGQLDISAEAG